MPQDAVEAHLALRRAMTPAIVPSKAALLVIDMQEYQVRKGWTCYRAANEFSPGLLDDFMHQVETVAEPNIARLVDLFREKGMRIVYTKFSSFSKDGSDLTRQLQTLNAAMRERWGEALFPDVDHPGSEIVASLEPREEDLVVAKNTSGVFTATNLELLLQNMGIEQLIVCGVVTNMCVEGAARTGAELGFDVFLVSDACAAWSPEIHEATLRSFELLFGFTAPTDRVIEEIRKSA
jgi:nicotinamidase-related amidase